MSPRTYVLRIALLMAVAITANAQTGATVDGRVVDERSGKPLAGLGVLLGGHPGFRLTIVNTDSNGAYRFTGISAGSYSLNINDSRARPVFTRITVGDQGLHVPDLHTHLKIELVGRVEPPGWQHLMVNAWDRNGGRYGVSIRPDGTFLLWLEEGEYRISANVPKTHVVKSMSFGSRDLTKNPLVVQAATFEEIRIVIAEK